MQEIVNNFVLLFEILKYTWWLFVPIFAVHLAAETWKYYLVTKEMKGVKWILLEIRIPREILKSPEAMERVFFGLHGPYDPPETFKDFYLKPKVRLWYNFEIVGQGGDIRFYVYAPKSWRNIIEAQMYAQYPDISIVEAEEDYTKSVPDKIPTDDYDMWGMEITFVKENGYPILTYRDLLSLAEASDKEELKVDPLSAFAESLAKLRPGEQIWFQILARPCGPPGRGGNDDWQKRGQELVDKLAGKPPKPKEKPWWSLIPELIVAFGEEIGEHAAELAKPGSSSHESGLGRFAKKDEKKDDKKDPSKMMHTTPGEKDVIAAVERKISKPGYESIVRIVYIARRDVFEMSTIGSLFGMIKQFNTNHLNAFKPNGDILTKKKNYFWGFYESTKYMLKIKHGLLYSYKHRSPFWDLKNPLPGSILPKFWATLYQLFPNSVEYMRSKQVVFNSEELATLFHFPGGTVSSPMMPRIEAKQGEPPINLPTG